MKTVDKKIPKDKFNKAIYNSTSYLFVTSDDFWDGGIDSGASLKEKSKFYSLAFTMSNVLKELVTTLNEEIYVGDILCENEKMYADWSDLKKTELYRIVSKVFKRNQCYRLSVAEDSALIDLMIESNFKYYTYFSFFLPRSNIIIQPTNHTELIIYSENLQDVYHTLENIVKPYDNINIKRKH